MTTTERLSGAESAARIIGLSRWPTEPVCLGDLFNRLSLQSAEIERSQREFMQSVEKANVQMP